jgi:hypothetical protein
MDLTLFDDMAAEDLRHYLQFLLRHYRQMDSFWYLYLAEQYGEEAADRLNEKVWGRVAGLGAKDILQRFDIQERGLEGFVQALHYWPWHLLVGYQYERQGDAVVLTVPSCPTQEARLKRGLAEYHCKEMHRQEFGCFAQAIDPRIQTECLLAPPDPHPPEMFCKWRFYLKGEG